MRVLITSGGTREPIDGVRALVNTSTGKTGSILAKQFLLAGDKVTLLHGKHACIPEGPGYRLIEYTSFKDLEERLRRLLETEPPFDVIIHAAAVSDYSPVEIRTSTGESIPAGAEGKISSDSDEITIRLVSNRKLIDQIRQLAPSSLIVAFKLTNRETEHRQRQLIERLLERGVCDLLVHNDLEMIGEGMHKATVYRTDGRKAASAETKEELAHILDQLCRNIVQEKE
jgi:phosphopantothenate--cysteine ligase